MPPISYSNLICMCRQLYIPILHVSIVHTCFYCSLHLLRGFGQPMLVWPTLALIVKLDMQYLGIPLSEQWCYSSSDRLKSWLMTQYHTAAMLYIPKRTLWHSKSVGNLLRHALLSEYWILQNWPPPYYPHTHHHYSMMNGWKSSNSSWLFVLCLCLMPVLFIMVWTLLFTSYLAHS